MKKSQFIIGAIVFSLMLACSKEQTSPTVVTKPVLKITTSEASRITHIHVFVGGTIVDDGGSPTTSRGVCWSTTPSPTIDGNKTTDLFGLSPGFFPSFVTGLDANTTYYVRAYGSNSDGTAYGQEVKFVTLNNLSGQTGTVIDIEGNSYHTVGIGCQIWMAENLKTTKYTDGTSIPEVIDDNEWSTLAKPAYCIYNNDLNNKSIYGLIYNWHALDAAANGNRNVCPTGWHVPSDDEWTTLKSYLGEIESGTWSMTTSATGEGIAGTKLKETGTTHWTSPNSGTNETGFKALPGGYRYSDGFCNKIGKIGVWWSSTKLNYGSMDAYANDIYNDNSVLGNGTWSRSTGASVRCVKD